MTIDLRHGDSREILKTLADCSIDSCVTDPPYALVSIVKRFGGANAAQAKEGSDGLYRRASAGFMGQRWDTGDTAFDPEFWADILRVLKPGAHLIAFGGTRTYHRLACAIEDAGFEIRDQLQWLYGSGFPKSHDVAKGIDKGAGVERRVVGKQTLSNDIRGGGLLDAAHGARPAFERDVTVATSDGAKLWAGWGTALKPACEPIVLARKPLIGTVAANVLRHGTGALNIDGCRVDGAVPVFEKLGGVTPNGIYGDGLHNSARTGMTREGRWPANVVHDGSDEVVEAFPAAPGAQRAVAGDEDSRPGHNGGFGRSPSSEPRGDSGSAARFFYSSKADADDRFGSKHPTVKPVDLMRWLARLVTPPGGIVLDPFAGSGTTGIAAMAEGFNAILIEREASYIADIQARIDFYSGNGPMREQAMARNKKAEPFVSTLFGELP